MTENKQTSNIKKNRISLPKFSFPKVKLTNKQLSVGGLVLNFIGVILIVVTLVFTLCTHNSPPEIHGEMILVQRPDSIFQAQLFIWNEGDQTAEGINFYAKYANVFLTDTAYIKNKKKTNYRINQNVWPILSVSSKITPTKILNHLGEQISHPDYHVVIPKLPKHDRHRNFFVISPKLINRKNWDKERFLLYKKKFVELKNFEDISNYIDELLNDNIKVEWNGEFLNLSLSEIVYYSDIDTPESRYYFPTEKELPNRSNPKDPNYFLPPFIIKKEKQRGGGFSGWSRW